MSAGGDYILWFRELGINDVPVVGGKNASLGEMYKKLTKKGVSVPDGFAVTAEAYRYLLKEAGIEQEIKDILRDLNTNSIKNLRERGKKVRKAILRAEFPDDLKKAIEKAYAKLCKEYGSNTDVAVRSSATAEDLPDASFAGQQETYLNIRGEYELLEACKKCFASLFTDRAISYREDKGFDHFKVALSIGVQKMVRSDKAAAGVMFSIDTESGFRDVVFITSAYGLGENVVQGAVNPDEFYVFKPTLKKGFKPIISKTVGAKSMRMIYAEDGSKHPTKNTSVPGEMRREFSITDEEVLKLAEWAVIIEDHYKKPMDMEWAKDGITGELFIVQARPETVQSQKDATTFEDYKMLEKGKVLIQGQSVGSKIGAGKVKVIKSAHDMHRFKKGEILVTDMTDPDWEPIMKIASAIVTNRGGRTCFTGDTKVLTNEGFKTFEQIYKGYDGEQPLKVPSLNRETLKIEWKPVLATMKRTGEVIEINTSQTGRVKENTLRLTRDHKVLTFDNRRLVSKEISEILNNKEMLLAAQKLPSLRLPIEKKKELAYLLGAVCTDGHIYLSDRHGEVTFIQKDIPEKKEFIQSVCNSMSSAYGKQFKPSKKKPSMGTIRGSPVFGEANAYRCYSKETAMLMSIEQLNLVQTLLHADMDIVYNFLAGVIDGDGSIVPGRINIYCSNDDLLQAITISCLRIGTVPQVSRNRNIYNVQIVEKINEISEFTKRLKGVSSRKCMSSRLFSARQLLSDCIEEVNYKGGIRPYVDQNLLLGSKKIREQIMPLADDETGVELSRILESDTRMLRTNLVRHLGEQEVYNITVEDNHNYLVFTDRYTPIIVNNCHAAIVSRELGIPCVVGTLRATEVLKDKQKVTVSCGEGEDGFVYDGLLKFKVDKINLKKVPKTKTKIMMNLANPEQAFESSFLPNDGVGLAREEFVINGHIKIHPLALLHYKKLKKKREHADLIEEIDSLTYGYKDKAEFFVDRLAQGVGMIAAAFYPKDVILRFSDFKSNEYANLIGGKLYEPDESNPMIGWRGASRYYSPEYEEAFALECRAIKKVREEFGLTNLKVMIPFCRTVEEGKKVLSAMRKNGLKRGIKGLEVYVMCEIPSNVILADQFSEIFDGFSIGSNDLTQLTLGLDRDSELVNHIYDERNDAVKRLVADVIKTAKKKKRKIGICGQAPSDFPDFAEFLVEQGIDSISLNPDTVVKTRLKIAKKEKKL